MKKFIMTTHITKIGNNIYIKYLFTFVLFLASFHNGMSKDIISSSFSTHVRNNLDTENDGKIVKVELVNNRVLSIESELSIGIGSGKKRGTSSDTKSSNCVGCNNTREMLSIGRKLPTVFLSITCVQNGEWNNPSTWSSGTVPTSNDDVSIGMAYTVLLSGTINANSIMLMGIMRPSNLTTDFNITTRGIGIMGSKGLLEIGTSTTPFTGKGTITLTGSNSNQSLFNSMPGMGTKMIGVMNGARLELHGNPKKSWSHLQGSVAAGSSQITIKEAVNWAVGDEIVIVSSRLNWEEAEKRTITSVNPDNKTFSFSVPLSYPHAGTVNTYIRPTDNKIWTADLRAEVGLLSHNIRIQGDSGSTSDSFGGHIMVMMNGQAHLNYVEMYRMGQKSRLGRYPFHWHFLYNGGTGQFVKNSSVHQSFNRALVIHGTSNTTVENNFFYDHIGHGLFLEDGSETNNLIKGNVVLLTKRPLPGEEITPSDNERNEIQNRTPSSYWITNPNNTFENNVAAGTEGTGFWYALAQDFMGDSKNNPAFSGKTKPFKEVFGGFQGNTAHSCMSGFDIFDRLNENHAIISNDGWDQSDLKYFNNNTWYANDLGVYSGVGDSKVLTSTLIFKDNVFVENRVATMFASYNVVDESVFVASTKDNLIDGERFLYRVYDGAGTVRNSHFVGWNEANSNFLINTGASKKQANALFENITFNNSYPIRASYPNFNREGENIFHHLYESSASTTVLKDKTGSITGKVGSTIISNFHMLNVGDESTLQSWQNLNYTHRNYVHAILSYNLIQLPSLSITRTKPNTPYASFYDRFGTLTRNHQMSVIVNDNFLYTYIYEQLPSTKIVNQRVVDAIVGDTYVSRYKDFGKLGGLTVTATNGTLSVYNSLNSLLSGNNAGYFIEPQGDLYLKSISVKDDQTYTISWTTDFAVPILDTDGDGKSDYEESIANKVPSDAYDLGFSFASGTEGWIIGGTGVTNCVACNGAWNITSNGSNTQIERSALNFNANSVPNVFVDLEANVAGSFQLFWTTADEPNFSDSKSVIVNYTTVGVRKLLEFNLNNNLQWQGQTITKLRLDLLSNVGTSKIYNIYANEMFDIDGDGLSNVQELNECRNANNASDFGFNFNNDVKWSAINITNFIETNGMVYGTTNTGDGYFVLLNPLNLNGNAVSSLKLRIKMSASGSVQLHWKNEDGGYSGERSVTQVYTMPNTWQELTFNLGSNNNWVGKTISSLRIDPINQTNINFEIDWIRSTGYTECENCIPIPAAPILTASPYSIYEGQSSTISASNCSGTVTWSNGLGTGPSKTVMPATNTDYMATCTVNGCTSTSTSVTVNIWFCK